MASIGEELRRERQRRGLTLEQVTDVLHIKVAYLHALEHDEFNQIPGTIYTKGFIKNYSDFLGLDSQRLVDTFKNKVGESLTIPKRRLVVKEDTADVLREQELIEEPKQRLTYQGRQARRQRTLIRERFILAVILVLIAVFLGWLFFV